MDELDKTTENFIDEFTPVRIVVKKTLTDKPETRKMNDNELYAYLLPLYGVSEEEVSTAKKALDLLDYGTVSRARRFMQQKYADLRDPETYNARCRRGRQLTMIFGKGIEKSDVNPT